MTTTVSDDVDTLLDLLSLLPPFRGDWDSEGQWNSRVKVPRFWARFVDATQAEGPPSSRSQSFYEGRIYYMESKLDRYSKEVPAEAREAAHLAAYCLQFFAVTRSEDACELLGKHFTPTFAMPDGNAALGRRWADELVAAAWRVYRSIGTPTASSTSLVPGRAISPTSTLR